MNVFSYRGALPPKSPVFFGRENELSKLLEIARPPLRSYAIIFGGRQLGKTSLLYQLRAYLPTDIQFVQIDLTPLKGNDAQDVYSYIAEELIDHLDPVSKRALQPINNGTRFKRFLQELDPNSFVIVALDELGGLTDGASQSLASTLRSIHQTRFKPEHKALEHFLFILAGGMELYRPVSLSPVSPLYNISEKLYLRDLSRGEHDQLLLYGLVQAGISAEEAHQCCPMIYELTHGHPYITQRLGDMVAKHFIRHQFVPDAGVIHNFAARLVADDEVHIGPMLKLVQLENLQKSVMQIVTHPGKLPFVRADSDIARLELISLIREDHGCCIIRNKLYAQALSGILGISLSPVSSQMQQPESGVVEIPENDSIVHSQPFDPTSYTKRKYIFISYSHKDEVWMQRLVTMLTPLVRKEIIKIWTDKQIQPGDIWRKEISNALASAKVAVLLVTPDFLASDFIAKHELPSLLKAAQMDGLTILWIAVSACMYKNTEVDAFQSLNDPNVPLDELKRAKRNQELVRICEQIKQLADSQ